MHQIPLENFHSIDFHSMPYAPPITTLLVFCANSEEESLFTKVATSAGFRFTKQGDILVIHPTAEFQGNHKVQAIWLFLTALGAVKSGATKSKIKIQEFNSFYFAFDAAIKGHKYNMMNCILKTKGSFTGFLTIDATTALHLHQSGFNIAANTPEQVFTLEETKDLIAALQPTRSFRSETSYKKVS